MRRHPRLSGRPGDAANVARVTGVGAGGSTRQVVATCGRATWRCRVSCHTQSNFRSCRWYTHWISLCMFRSKRTMQRAITHVHSSRSDAAGAHVTQQGNGGGCWAPPPAPPHMSKWPTSNVNERKPTLAPFHASSERPAFHKVGRQGLAGESQLLPPSGTLLKLEYYNNRVAGALQMHCIVVGIDAAATMTTPWLASVDVKGRAAGRAAARQDQCSLKMQ